MNDLRMPGKIGRRPRPAGAARVVAVVAASLLIALPTIAPAQDQAAPPAAADAQNQAPPPLTAAQLDQLLAPIALYPDALLAQVLMASSYPLDVVAADRWLAKNGNLTGDQMEQALEQQPWDISVKIMTHFPSVLKYMDENLDWTQALGDAFINQQSDVMASVQHLRAEAYSAGNLKTTPQQTVTNADNAITIVPADGQTIYVPQYNPTTIYTQGPTTVVTGSGTTTVVTQPTTTTTTQPGYSSGDLIATGLLSFGAGILVGSLINDNYCDWGRGVVYVPVYHGPGWGYSGWGRPPPGWGYNGWNRPVHYGNNNINVNINNGSVRPWQPNNGRRPTPYGGKPGYGQGTRPGGSDFGYGSPGKPGAGGTKLPPTKPAAGSAGAFAGYGRGNATQQDSNRGAQSLGGAGKPGNNKPGANKPGSGKPAGGVVPPANLNKGKPNQGGFGQAGGTPGGNRGGAFPGVGGNGGFDRAASNRGRGSMGSAQQHGFKPQKNR